MKRFRMQVHGSVSLYLSMIIERNREHYTINIDQHSYGRTIFAKFRMDESRPVATSMAMKLRKRKPDKETCDPTAYQSMIGSLMFTITTTWPDIAYTTRVSSRNNHDPSNEHMVALRRVFWCLNSTKDWRLRFGGAFTGALGASTLGGEGEGVLRCYIDSDYAGCLDDYKLTSRLVITCGGAVDWRSRIQKSTAQSTTDAKYYVFGVGCMRLTQSSHLLNKLGIPPIPPVFSDSQ
jgi:hypothetical protein